MESAVNDVTAGTRYCPGTGATGFELASARLGALPVIRHFAQRAGLPALLARYLPPADARLRLDPARVIYVVVANLLAGRAPLYRLAEWAAPYAPEVLGLGGPPGPLNDDRTGRALEQLSGADRASLLTELIVGVIAAFGIDVSELHNDSTSVSVYGAYPGADGRCRGGKPTPAITVGHSKDHRPDLKQLVWILTVTGDHSVPIACRLADGNTSDDPTHIGTWDQLAALTGRTDFLYVADCKLATREAMRHIDAQRGRFVTVLPRSRSEDAWFRTWVASGNLPAWREALRLPGRRAGDPDRVYSTFASPLPTAEGYRIEWVHSSDKQGHDAAARQASIQAATTAIDALAARLARPKCQLKSRVAAETEASRLLAKAGAARWVSAVITQTTQETYRQEHRGAAGPATRYRKITKTRFTATWHINTAQVAADAATDGCFPLVSNDRNLTGAQLLAAYKYQPSLERRHHLLKSAQNAAPVLLHNPARIEALFCCHFFALLLAALIERQIRHAMAQAGTPEIPLYPELRDCASPSTERILEILTDLTRHDLYQHGQHLQTFHPQLTPLQLQVLNLLGVPATAYTPAS